MIKHVKDTLAHYTANDTGVRRHAAVLLPLIEIKGEWHVLFEKRSSALTTQPGEVCFPGGRVEPGETYLQGAIRETCEELNIQPKAIEVIGQIDSLATHFDMLIHCFVGILHLPFDTLKPSKDEVAYVFTKPLKDVLETPPEFHYLDSQFVASSDFPFDKIPEGKNYNFRKQSYSVLFYKTPEDIVWGLTAKMLYQFAQLVGDAPLSEP